MMLSLRFPTMPALVSDIIIDTDSESEDEMLPKTPPTPTASLQTLTTQFRKSPPILAPNQRYIAGSKRVHRFRETQGMCVAQKGQEVLQSITAVPGLGHQSFEVRPTLICRHLGHTTNPLIAFSYVCPHRVAPNLTCDLSITYLGAENGVLPAMPIGHGIFSPGS